MTSEPFVIIVVARGAVGSPTGPPAALGRRRRGSRPRARRGGGPRDAPDASREHRASGVHRGRVRDGVRQGVVRHLLPRSRLDVAGLAAKVRVPPRVVVVVVVVVVARRRFGEDALGEALEAGPQGRVLQRASRGGVIIFRRGFHASVAATRGGAVSVCGPLKLAQGASTRVAARKRRGGHHARGNRRAIRRVNPQGGGGAVASFRRGFREEFSAQLSLAVLNGTEKSTGQFGATPPPSVRWRARGWADGSHGPRRGRRPARAMERTHGEAEAKGRGGGGEATVRPLNPSPPTHAPRAARDFHPCAEKRPVAKSPSRPPRLLPSPTLIDPTRVPPRHAGCATRRYPRGPPTSRRTASTTKERTPPTSSSPRMPPSANQPLAPRAGA